MKFRALLLQQMALWAWTAAATTLLAAGAPERLTLSTFLWFLLGHAAGYVQCLFGHPYRRLGWLFWGWSGLAILAFLAAYSQLTNAWIFAFGAFHGFVDVPLSFVFEESPIREWPQFFRRLFAAKALAAAGGWGLTVLLLSSGTGLAAPGLWIAGAFAAFMAVYCLWTLFRATLELFAACTLAPAYRIKPRGPGFSYFPLYGPVIVIANHAAYLDPCWLGKLIPRRIIPLMTSIFYDLPFLHWLMKRVIHAVRVQDSSYRYDAPELTEAISRLDEGECLVIFPEGTLMRDEDKPLRRFGQGIWHILRERPLTPVVTCWIEGNWGSFFSYWRGPPMTHKFPDFWRRITIVISEPLLVPPEILTAHQPVRQYLMDAVGDLRKLL